MAENRDGNWLLANGDSQQPGFLHGDRQIAQGSDNVFQETGLLASRPELQLRKQKDISPRLEIMPLKNVYDAFYLGNYPVKVIRGKEMPTQIVPVNLLLDSGRINGENQISDFGFRKPSEITNIQFRKTSDIPEPDREEFIRKHAHFLIAGPGQPIQLIRNPDAGSKKDAIVIVIDDAWTKNKPAQLTDEQWDFKKQQGMEREWAELRDIMDWIFYQYANARIREFLPIDIFRAFTDDIGHPKGDKTNTEPAYGNGRSGRTLDWKKLETRKSHKSHPHSLMSDAPPEENTCGHLVKISELDSAQRSAFIGDLKSVLSANEGPDGYKSHPTKINEKTKEVEWAEDNGSGISVGKAQWNQEKGELPDLLRAWKARSDKDGNGKFEEIFHGYVDLLTNPAREKEFRNTDFLGDKRTAKTNPFLAAMEKALDTPEFQQVQEELLEKKAERAIKVADKYGHTSLRFIAQVLDVANQKGWTGCEQRMRDGNVAAIPDDARGECTAIKAFEKASSDRAGNDRRNKRLDERFAKDRTAWLRKPTDNLSQTA
jgi:hypothetical protein